MQRPAIVGTQQSGNQRAESVRYRTCTLLQQQGIQAAGRSNGVDRAEASVILGIDRKKVGKLFEELTAAGLVIRQQGGWRGKQVRWFTSAAKAKAFHGRHLSGARIEQRPTVQPAAAPAPRGPFSSAGVGRYVDPPSGWVAAMGVR